MEDNILPPYFTLLTHLFPEHVKRNARIMKLLSSSHDEMVDAQEAVMLLKVYRSFLQILLTENADPFLTERVKDAFVAAVTEAGATLGTANAAGFKEKRNSISGVGSPAAQESCDDSHAIRS